MLQRIQEHEDLRQLFALRTVHIISCSRVHVNLLPLVVEENQVTVLLVLIECFQDDEHVLLRRIDRFTRLFITSMKTDLLLLVEMVHHLSDLLFDKYYVGATYLEGAAENKEFFAIGIEEFFHELLQFRDALEGLDL